jgi:hypothetical protein
MQQARHSFRTKLGDVFQKEFATLMLELSRTQTWRSGAQRPQDRRKRARKRV